MASASGAEACDHATAEYLGRGGPALYYRCAWCGAALVRQAGTWWSLRALSAIP